MQVLRYSLVQYFHGAGIAFGAGMFLMNTGEHSHAVSATSVCTQYFGINLYYLDLRFHSHGWLLSFRFIHFELAESPL